MPDTFTDPIAALQAKLVKYPQVRYEIVGNRITLYPVDTRGFRISLIEQARAERYTVAFEGWHEAFGDPAEALECVAFGLSEACRLQVWSRGRVDCRWVLERRRGTEWVPASTIGLWFFPFWRRPRVRCLQNRVLEAA